MAEKKNTKRTATKATKPKTKNTATKATDTETPPKGASIRMRNNGL